jgi:hypothetical protein
MRTLTTLDELRKRTKPAEAPSRRRWRWLGLLILLLLVGGTIWAVSPDSHMSRVQELQKELAKGNTLSPEERKAKFTELRNEMKQLTDDQKWELSAPMREKQKREMDRYFALSPKERTQYLDEKIDSSEKMRKEWEKKVSQPKAGSSGGGPPGGGGGRSGGGNGGSPKSREVVEKARKARLDRTSPEERAQSDQFRKEMNDRRKQRGLPVR